MTSGESTKVLPQRGDMQCAHGKQKQACSSCDPESAYKRTAASAKRRGLVFRIALDDYKRLTRMRCCLCGTDSEPRGLDRRDNRLSYYLENVQPMCADCNFAKGHRFSHHGFLNLVRRIYRYQELQEQYGQKNLSAMPD